MHTLAETMRCICILFEISFAISTCWLIHCLSLTLPVGLQSPYPSFSSSCRSFLTRCQLPSFMVSQSSSPLPLFPLGHSFQYLSCFSLPVQRVSFWFPAAYATYPSPLDYLFVRPSTTRESVVARFIFCCKWRLLSQELRAVSVVVGIMSVTLSRSIRKPHKKPK